MLTDIRRTLGLPFDIEFAVRNGIESICRPGGSGPRSLLGPPPERRCLWASWILLYLTTLR